MLKYFSLAIIVTIFLSGCGGAKVYNVTTPKVSGKYTKKQMHNAIVDAGQKQKWKFSHIGSDYMLAEFNVSNGKHIAKVEIKYSESTYSINYIDSVALKYDGENIHIAYNKWVMNFENEINANLAKISTGEKIFVTLKVPSAEITTYNSSAKKGSVTPVKNFSCENTYDVRTRLSELSALYEDGIINKKEYESSRKKILDDI